MKIFTVTAVNRYFYQKLAVMAEDKDAAEYKFAAYLHSPRNKAVEAEEYEAGLRFLVDFGPVDYVFRFRPDDITEEHDFPRRLPANEVQVIALKPGAPVEMVQW